MRSEILFVIVYGNRTVATRVGIQETHPERTGRARVPNTTCATVRSAWPTVGRTATRFAPIIAHAGTARCQEATTVPSHVYLVHFTQPPMPRLFRVLTAALAVSSLAGCDAKSGNAADSASVLPSSASPAVKVPPLPSAGPDPRVAAADAARIKGDVSAKLWIVVVSDFECPFCGQWERETAGQVTKEFVEPGIARLAFVNFPLRQHPNALPAAEAAMCAGAQGKFWAMHDRIFKTQGEWSLLPSAEAFFASAAVAVGVSAPEYTACIADHVMRPMIEADVERATAGGAGSTPTFFIGNQVISGAEKIEAFRAAVAQARSALPK